MAEHHCNSEESHERREPLGSPMDRDGLSPKEQEGCGAAGRHLDSQHIPVMVTTFQPGGECRRKVESDYVEQDEEQNFPNDDMANDDVDNDDMNADDEVESEEIGEEMDSITDLDDLSYDEFDLSEDDVRSEDSVDEEFEESEEMLEIKDNDSDSEIEVDIEYDQENDKIGNIQLDCGGGDSSPFNGDGVVRVMWMPKIKGYKALLLTIMVIKFLILMRKLMN
ncbi:hypothetical protein DMENIID0001_010630 [Sergentomyia squamirostris]